MQNSMGFTGESSDHKLAAIFASEPAAREAAVEVVDALGLDNDQVKVIKAGDDDAERKLEPESRGIWHTLIRAHLWLGLAGAVIGAILYFALSVAGVPFVVGNPAWASSMFIVLCFVGGLLVGGAVTVRPDHAPYIRAAVSALRDGKSLVIVHARDLEQLRQAKEELEKHDADVIPTL
ncbi:MAG: hypothetical protein R6V61_13550 [Wenzhouxiangellaceae bacterium]